MHHQFYLVYIYIRFGGTARIECSEGWHLHRTAFFMCHSPHALVLENGRVRVVYVHILTS